MEGKNLLQSAPSGDLVYSVGAHRYLAPYACIPEQSHGRLHAEEEGVGRSCYQRDRDRIIHSTAFRRLEYKTQVFVYHEGDHYRTRLTHSLEVGQLARSTARELFLDEDLAEAVALAHDLGHTPFGHAGEDALSECMEGYGGFDHNAQSVRILTHLENIYANFDGLNLTWECLEGIAKHNGPVTGDVPRALKEYVAEHDLELNGYASLEAQVAALCDDIAYNNHDIEDGFRAGLFTIDEVCALPFIGQLFQWFSENHPELQEQRLIHEAKRKAISLMVRDMVDTSLAAIEQAGVAHVDDVRSCGKQLVCFSEQMQADMLEIKAFLYERMYKHFKVNRMTSKAKRVVSDLFEFFLKQPDCLPGHWRQQVELAPQEAVKAVIIADYIAGMTDRFAMLEHRRIFDLNYRLIGD